eukprot:10177252-Alexandrium_andersonii.AAC.1
MHATHANDIRAPPMKPARDAPARTAEGHHCAKTLPVCCTGRTGAWPLAACRLNRNFIDATSPSWET